MVAFLDDFPNRLREAIMQETVRVVFAEGRSQEVILPRSRISRSAGRGASRKRCAAGPWSP